MLTQEEHVEIHALRKRGWSYSAIARHAGLSRNTVKAYLRDGRRPGERYTAIGGGPVRALPGLRGPARITARSGPTGRSRAT